MSKQKKEISFSVACRCGQVKKIVAVETATEYEVECPHCKLVILFEVRYIYSPPE